MTTKWARFKAKNDTYQLSRSPFDLSDINRNDSNIVEDWNRVDAGPVTINGRSIQDLLKEDRNVSELTAGQLFANKDELKAFFIKHLLKHLNPEKQDAAVVEMMKFLHQGALQCPVSSASFFHFKDDILQPVDARNKDKGVPGQIRELNFVATESGFKVQEILTQNRLAYNINAGDLAGDFVLPDPGNTYVYKAQGTINIDFSQDPSKPKIDVENSTISFGNEKIEQMLDARTFLQKFIDVVKSIFGYNEVENLATVEFDPENEPSCGVGFRV